MIDLIFKFDFLQHRIVYCYYIRNNQKNVGYIDDEISIENTACHITEKYQVAKIGIPEICYVYLINLSKI